VLDFEGAPAKSGQLLLALSECQERVEVRRAFQMVRAIQDSFSDVIPLTYFQALYDDPEEAQAMHNLL